MSESAKTTPLRICHLISGDLWAGAEVMAYHLLNGLRKLPNIDLFVIILNKGKLSEALENLGIAVYLLDENEQSFLKIAREAAKIVRERMPQILHSHRYKENILSYFISKALKNDAVLVSTQHGMPELYNRQPSFKYHIKSTINNRLLSFSFSKVVTVSQDIEELLLSNYGIQKKQIQVIQNGISVPEISHKQKQRYYFVVGSVGRFFPVKDYLFMVEIAREVLKKSSNFRFELAGEGPMLADIRDLIKKYGLEDHFILRGFVNEVSNFYQGLDVYLNTSKHEGIPMSVLEAMAYGLPAIVPKVGGLKEIVTDSVDGYLLDDRNPEDFANKCLYLSANESLRLKMAYAAREKIIREFSTQRMVKNYADMYMKLIRNNEP